MIRKAGGAAGQSGSKYLQFDFKMVFVSNISWSHNDPSPNEEITFDYGALQVHYWPQTKTGAVAGPDKHSAWSRLLNSTEFEVPA